MKETVEHWIPMERDLFLQLNGSDSIFLDNLFWTITNFWMWATMLLAFIIFFFYRKTWQEGVLLILFVALLITANDLVSSGFFKPYFMRYRPTHHPDFQNVVDIVNGYRGGLYGFISGHATNSFGLALFFSFLYRNKWLTLAAYTWAILFAYSRIYLGVHFLTDIAAGIVVGSIIGGVMFALYRKVRYALLPIPTRLKHKPLYSRYEGRRMAIITFVYIILLVSLSPILGTI